MASGECNCGAVGFEIEQQTNDVFVCHCSICRRSSGSNGIAVIVVANDAFHWTRGTEAIRTWQKPDAEWQTWFCGQCGSPLPSRNDESRMFIPAGLLTVGAESLTVKHHIYVDSKAAWDEIGDNGQRHENAFQD